MNHTSEQLRRYRLPKPPVLEQRAITEYLDHEMERLNTITSKVENAIDILQKYRSSLITAAVTGKIDVRNVNLTERGASLNETEALELPV